MHVRISRGTGVMRAAFARCAAALCLALPTIAYSQESAVPVAPSAPPSLITASGALPRDLSPWGMFLTADPLVQAVLVGLVFASVVTWTVWVAKSIELLAARRLAREAFRTLASARSF